MRLVPIVGFHANANGRLTQRGGGVDLRMVVIVSLGFLIGRDFSACLVIGIYFYLSFRSDLKILFGDIMKFPCKNVYLSFLKIIFVS